MKKVSFFGKDIPVIYEMDCVVVGGGTGGVAAALSALENNIKTVIVEKTISLGGTQTNSLVSPMMPTNVPRQYINRLITERLQQERIKTDDGTTSCNWFNVEALSYVMEQLIVERGGEILYDANYIDCLKENNKITHIIVNTCEGLGAIHGRTFIDATADALLSRTAGVKTNSGNNEGHNQQVTFRFEMGGIDIATLRKYLLSKNDTYCKIKDSDFFEIAMVQGKGHTLEPLFQKAFNNGDLQQEDLRYFQGFTQPGKPNVMSFNCPHIPNILQTTNPIARSKAVVKGREMIRRLVNFLVNYVPGFQHAFLLREASQLGIRESWRIVGQYVLTEEDYIKRARFTDGIARGDWYIDIHSVKNEEIPKVQFSPGEYYEIPYRSLITFEVDNLIVAGRHISSTFLMQASLRIQPTIRDIGQAAGLACALSVKENIPLNQLDGVALRRQLQLMEEL
ncbi:FAD-dependent oxidoreductase [Bacillus kwashiorkori]|uniref:FAD-dependent oxidoreductase n=1 Tax=Bacillus kwashiorkori TaxID=1522318 RepID=UPI000782CA96|nr:FAD-dependent oxidoreductase [Bacillus kwashiorkori]